MTVVAQDQIRRAKELARISSILSICSYAFVLLLFVSSLRLFLRAPPEPSKSIRQFLLAFIISMFCVYTLATISALVLNFAYPTASFFSFSASSINKSLCSPLNCFPIRVIENCCVTLVIWGADCFMIWRCTVLYRGISRVRRQILLAFCSILALLSFAIGLVYALPFTRRDLALTLFSSVTLVINFTITSLIVGRLLYHRHYLLEAFGPGHRSPYLRVTVMCIESASVVVAFNGVLLVLVSTQSQINSSLTLLQMMVQVYVISPFLIIFKVAHDKVRRPTTSPLRTGDAQELVNRDLKTLESSKEPSNPPTMATSEC